MGKRIKGSEPTAKLRPHEKMIVLRMEIGKDLLREPRAGDIVAQIAKRRIEEFKSREGLDGTGIRGNAQDKTSN